MKTFKFALAALLLAGSAAIAVAGPGPQYWIRPAAPKPAPAVTPATTPATTPAPVQTASAQPAACTCTSGCSMMHR